MRGCRRPRRLDRLSCMFAARQLRVRVLEALEGRVKQFLRREELWPLRVPREPLLVRRRPPAGDRRRGAPVRCRVAEVAHRCCRSNGQTAAAGRRGSACLPSGLKIYCDTGERREPACWRRAGATKGTRATGRFSSCSPSRRAVTSASRWPAARRDRCDHRWTASSWSIASSNLFEVTGSEDSLRAQLPEPPDADAAPPGGRDFRADVERWLDAALRRRSVTCFSGTLTALQVPSPAPS